MLQGMTAHYLSNSTYPLREGDTALVHSGAGGVGLLLIQMAKMRGATVITTVSTGEKAELAKGAGAGPRHPVHPDGLCRGSEGESPAG